MDLKVSATESSPAATAMVTPFDQCFQQFLPSDAFLFDQPMPPLDEHFPSHPHSCPPSLLPSAADLAPDLAPHLQLPRNLSSVPADHLHIISEQHSLAPPSPPPAPPTPAPPTPAPPTPVHPVSPILSHPLPLIPPTTPARPALQHPPASSPHICTPLSALTISTSIPPPPLPASSPAITPKISKRTRPTKRTRLPGTPVTPSIQPPSHPILHPLKSLHLMSNFGSHPSDVDTLCKHVDQCVETRARNRKLQLRSQLKYDPAVSSSQREAKVSRLYQSQILDGYRAAIRELVRAWYNDSTAARRRP